MPQSPPIPNTLYYIQNVATGNYLELPKSAQSETLEVNPPTDALKQQWKFIVTGGTGSKITYKIVNGAPDPEDRDSYFALGVDKSFGPDLAMAVAEDEDTVAISWRIAISTDGDHCSLIAHDPQTPQSKDRLGIDETVVKVSADNKENTQKWRIVKWSPPNSDGAERLSEIPEGKYYIQNVSNKARAYVEPDKMYILSQPAGSAEHPVVIRYENPTSPYFVIKPEDEWGHIIHDGSSVVFASNPALWYLVRDSASRGYHICPKRSGRRLAWSGESSSSRVYQLVDWQENAPIQLWTLRYHA